MIKKLPISLPKKKQNTHTHRVWAHASTIIKRRGFVSQIKREKTIKSIDCFRESEIERNLLCILIDNGGLFIWRITIHRISIIQGK